MTLTLELDIDMVRIYHHTKNGVFVSTTSKIKPTYRHTYRHNKSITFTGGKYVFQPYSKPMMSTLAKKLHNGLHTEQWLDISDYEMISPGTKYEDF